MSGMIVEKLPIGLLITYFLVYVIIHFIIGIYRDNVGKDLEEKPGNEELENAFRNSNILFKWFPAIAVVIIVILLYFV